MRILLVHNYYRQPGGEDVVFAAERELLRERGHDVRTLEFDNADIPDDTVTVNGLKLAVRTVWSRPGAAVIRDELAARPAEVVHFHNTFPQVSPAAYSAARSQGAAVVQTLHNYRLVCPNAELYRDGQVCEDCLGRRISWPAVLHACYRNSRTQTAVVTAMLAVHRARRTWSRDVDRFIALTTFARSRFIAGGLPADRVEVKPNFVAPDPGPGPAGGDHLLFVGRLVATKGVLLLAEAWRASGQSVPLHIVGDGPLRPVIERFARETATVEYLGPIAHDAVLSEMRAAQALVFPSTWYEGFPVTIVEALASGLPVIAARLGSMEEIVDDGVTGLHFAAGDPQDLARAIDRMTGGPPEQLASMGAAARAAFEASFTAERNYDQLLAVYKAALQERHTDAR